MSRMHPLFRVMFGRDLVFFQARVADRDVAERPSFTDRISSVIEHAEPQVAIRAARILAQRSRSSDVVSALAHALRRRWQEPDVAAAIVRAIGRFADTAAHDALLDALGHESFAVRVAAAAGLQARGRAVSIGGDGDRSGTRD